MSDKILKNTVLAMGYFDSVHQGHQEVIKIAKEVANRLDSQLVVFSFDGNLKAALSGEKDLYVYSPAERKELIYALGADDIYFAPLGFEFLSLGKLAFLNKMNRKYAVKAYVCGEDYRFGKFGEGAVKDLQKYAGSREQEVVVVPTVTSGDKKIATTTIKKFLANGEIKLANQCLTRPYSLIGEIVKGRGVGKSLGFATANFIPDTEKQTLKDGVYKGHAEIDGKVYNAVINYGTRPTFHLSDKLVEAHFIDYEGDLYGKTLTVYFDSFIRDIQKFFSETDLKNQILSDVNGVKEGKYD